MFKSIVNWWKGQFGDGSVTYQEDKSVKYAQEYTEIYGEFPDGSKVKLYKSGINKLYVTVDNTFRKEFHFFDKWEAPMIELFLLLIKDRYNWTLEIKKPERIYFHTVLGIRLGYEATLDEFVRRPCYKWNVEGLTLTQQQIHTVMYAVDLYQYTDKFIRLRNINLIRKQRLDKLNRENEAKRIREYLENVI